MVTSEAKKPHRLKEGNLCKIEMTMFLQAVIVVHWGIYDINPFTLYVCDANTVQSYLCFHSFLLSKSTLEILC